MPTIELVLRDDHNQVGSSRVLVEPTRVTADIDTSFCF